MTMPHSAIASCAAALAGAALLATAPVAAIQQAPPPDAPQSAPAAVPSSAPAPARPAGDPGVAVPPPPPPPPTEMPVLPKIFETQLVEPPSPTISMLFGQRVGAANGQFLVSGPVRATFDGRFGQLANYTLADGIWTANRQMADVDGAKGRDFVMQRLAAAGQVAAVSIERQGPMLSSVAVLEPEGVNWVQRALLTSPPTLPRPGFGSAIATDGQTIAVAAVDLRFTDKPGMPIDNPEVHLFSRKGGAWEREGTVMLPPASNKTRVAYWFGASLAMDTGVLAVGCPGSIPPRAHEMTPSTGECFVFVFRKGADGWRLEAEIDGSKVTPIQGFGSQVAIEGDLLAVRALQLADDREPSRVFLYRRIEGSWRPAGELVPAQGLGRTRSFGTKIAISKGRVLVSELSALAADNGPNPSLGMVLVFEEREGTWVNTMRLQPKAPCMPGQFGQDIAAMWPWVAVGRVKNERENIPGGAYLYKLGP
jgi:hypothetical protein